MSEKAENVVMRYETARQLVSKLKSKRLNLINDCENIGFSEDEYGFKYPYGKTCLTSIFDAWQKDQEGVSYMEAVEYEHNGDRCCESCYQAYKLKQGPLKEAKKELGNAKRQLSYIGKKLIKEANQ